MNNLPGPKLTEEEEKLCVQGYRDAFWKTMPTARDPAYLLGWRNGRDDRLGKGGGQYDRAAFYERLHCENLKK